MTESLTTSHQEFSARILSAPSPQVWSFDHLYSGLYCFHIGANLGLYRVVYGQFSLRAGNNPQNLFKHQMAKIGRKYFENNVRYHRASRKPLTPNMVLLIPSARMPRAPKHVGFSAHAHPILPCSLNLID